MCECDCSEFNHEQVVRDSGLIVITKSRETGWITYFKKSEGFDHETSMQATCCDWAELCQELELDGLVEHKPTPAMALTANKEFPHDKPFGVFHGSILRHYGGKAVYHGDYNQKIIVDDTSQRDYWPDQLTASELMVCRGRYWRHSSPY